MNLEDPSRFMGNLLVKFQRNLGNAGTVRFDLPPSLLKPRPNRRGFFGNIYCNPPVRRVADAMAPEPEPIESTSHSCFAVALLVCLVPKS